MPRLSVCWKLPLVNKSDTRRNSAAAGTSFSSSLAQPRRAPAVLLRFLDTLSHRSRAVPVAPAAGEWLASVLLPRRLAGDDDTTRTACANVHSSRARAAEPLKCPHNLVQQPCAPTSTAPSRPPPLASARRHPPSSLQSRPPELQRPSHRPPPPLRPAQQPAGHALLPLCALGGGPAFAQGSLGPHLRRIASAPPAPDRYPPRHRLRAGHHHGVVRALRRPGHGRRAPERGGRARPGARRGAGARARGQGRVRRGGCGGAAVRGRLVRRRVLQPGAPARPPSLPRALCRRTS